MWLNFGTITVQSGSRYVDGQGTQFVGPVLAGYGLLTGDLRLYEIEAVESATRLRLVRPYQGGGAANVPYDIVPIGADVAALVERIQALIDRYQSFRDTVGQGMFPDGSAAAPGVRFSADQDTGIRRSSDNVLAVTAGGKDAADFGPGGSTLYASGQRTAAALVDEARFYSTLSGRNTTGADKPYYSHTFTSASGIPVSAVRAIQMPGDYPDAGALGFYSAYGSLAERLRLESLGTVRPGTDNAQIFGSAAYRWSVIFAGTGSINTSDARAKSEVGAIPDAWLDAWGSVDWQRYKFADAVEAKGDDSRWHIGLIAQQVRDAFAAQGIDALTLGLLCYDEWEAIPAKAEVRDDDGRVTEAAQPARPAGDRWGLRYDECQAMEAAYQRRRIARLESQIALLSARHD